MRVIGGSWAVVLMAIAGCEDPPDRTTDSGPGPDAGLPGDGGSREDAGPLDDGGSREDAAQWNDEDPPPNPSLAASSWPIYHGDSYARHYSDLPAVEGAAEVSVDLVELDGDAIFVLFDPVDDIFTVARGLTGASLWKIDRESLAVVGRVDLSAEGAFAGVYGFVDAAGDPVLGIGKRVVRYEGPGGTLAEEAAAELGDVLGEEEVLVAASALFSGEIAFVGSEGTVGVLGSSLDGGPLATLQLGGSSVSNALSLDEDGGLFIVTSSAIHRVDWTGEDLQESWSHPVEAPYEEPRPGRLGTGSGTTPALMGRDRVVLADDAESVNLLVLRRTAGDGPREVCKLPAFDGEAATDNAIVVAGRTMIIEQNLTGLSGVARIDMSPEGRCERVWLADVLAPTSVPTLSTASGLVYVYSFDDASGWALTGLDLDTGQVRLTVPTGDGAAYNNVYSAVTVGPDRRIYVGVLAGLLVIADVP
ncbi:MAG: hypothetical protein HYY06_03205 [Deltaproteobacteria bacterium]|nr:hypothetical protein [Deltaproteobacteria bacterium]